MLQIFHYVQGSQDTVLHWVLRCWLEGSGFLVFSDGLLCKKEQEGDGRLKVGASPSELFMKFI